jgi:two-component system, chemotaxis family, chemotaxis protein CheY
MSYSILIVDDSATIRGYIKRTLRLARLSADQLHEAADGQQALAVLAAHRIDLILTDLHMPVMDGAEMTRRILADPATARIPVIVVSADPNAQRIEELRELGVRGHLRKPFTPEDIRRVVCGIMGGSHVGQA